MTPAGLTGGWGAYSKDPGKKVKAGVEEESNGQNRWEAEVSGVGADCRQLRSQSWTAAGCEDVFGYCWRDTVQSGKNVCR